MRAINLLPREDARRGRQKTQWIVLVPVVGAVLLTGVLSFAFLSASGKVKDKQAELATLQDSLLPVEVGDGELRAGLAELRSLVGDLTRRAREVTRTIGR